MRILLVLKRRGEKENVYASVIVYDIKLDLFLDLTIIVF